jgi:hypothetical protein
VVTSEQCNNGLDDDRDGFVDCLDPDCASNPVCLEQHASCLTARRISASGTYTGDTIGNVPQTAGSCGGDSGEAVFQLALTAPTRVRLDTRGSDFDTVLYVRTGSCQSGREIACDDDGGQQALSSLLTFNLLQPGNYFIFVDGFTVDPNRGPDEGDYVLNVDLASNPSENCQDGIDNDGDVYADCADPDCAGAAGCRTCAGGNPASPELGAEACTDGLDNDCDGLADCADSDCSASSTPTVECCNGLDQNDNGIPDDFSCRCASTSDCIAGQICYGNGVQACGIPCNLFVGDVCPFLAPGSKCNAATRQCEF